jgi:hypothetical protein
MPAAESLVTYRVASATDADTGVVYDLVDTLEITVAKSAVELSYALTYLRTVNDGPTEIIVAGDGGGPFNALTRPCVDDASSPAPSCGYVLAADGGRVPGSQGFCCRCSLTDYFGATSGGARNGLTCDLLSASGSQAANCLRMAPLWHAAFGVAAPQTAYRLDVAMRRCRGARNASAGGAPPPSCVWDVLEMSPSKPAGCTTFAPLPGAPASPRARGCDVQATLVGDFAAFQAPPDLSSYTLFKPLLCADSPPSPACLARLLANSSRWMLLPREAADLSGSACNRVGVSYAAYLAQGARCDVPAASCLRGQLRDYYAADVAAEAAGRPPTSLLAAVARGPYVLASVASAATAALVLGTAAYQQTVLQLTVDAAALRLVQRVSSGVIASAAVRPFAALAPGGGAAVVAVASTGAVNALFTLAVTCPADAPVAAVAAQQFTLAAPPAPASAAVKVFELGVTSLAGWAGACAVTLYDGLGAVTDVAALAVNATPTELTDGAEGGSVEPGAPGQSAGVGAGTGGGCAACGAWDLLCAARRLCVSALASWAAGLAGTLGALAAYAFLAAHFPAVACAPCRLLAGACGGAGGGGGGGGRAGQARLARRQQGSTGGRGGGGDNGNADGATVARLLELLTAQAALAAIAQQQQQQQHCPGKPAQPTPAPPPAPPPPASNNPLWLRSRPVAQTPAAAAAAPLAAATTALSVITEDPSTPTPEAAAPQPACGGGGKGRSGAGGA